ncbi:endonuclease/exonuclease/phosphatase [Artemisia annua]|uniref:Endonuclease/exonuclease/phosphatase n=1 Tax=Artemisia annua TaxID=35608 RepID=A0A2U1MC61_ARTAN|nr:endonuclease/exonuclease/phosphatase [Artemisia annua]
MHLNQGAFPRLPRQKSETSRAQFIFTKELRVSVNTRNLGGEVPPEDLDISEWLDINNPADVYVIGFQEIIPLNAGYIIGSEDTHPIPIWENIICKTLNKIQLVNIKFKCFSDPPSQSRFKPSKDTPNIKDEVVLESDIDSEQQLCIFNDSVPINSEGSVSVSMSIYQTHFCFICTHLTSGEREIDIIKRNTDVSEIYKRTHFNIDYVAALPRRIKDHERIIWLGDLNYRFDLSYEETCELISQKAWSKLLESDQLWKGGSFDGWTEGTLNFPPTYKYELNSDKYYGSDPKVGRRTPAWCDRILSFGKGIRQLSYQRTEDRLSDHRPVSASYMIEVEVLSLRMRCKLCDRILSFGKGIRQLSYQRTEDRLSDHRPVSASYMIEVEVLSLRVRCGLEFVGINLLRQTGEIVLLD